MLINRLSSVPVFLLFLLLGFPLQQAGAQGSATLDTGINLVPDVKSQFNLLAHRPDALGFRLGSSPVPNQTDHYQGIVRAQGSHGTPYFFVTRSGGGGPGNLLLVEMGSRDKHAERLRSNRLQRDVNTDASAPPTSDYAIETYSFDGLSGLPHYDHAGAMQLVGDVLAVPLEEPLADGLPQDRVVFLDVSRTLDESSREPPTLLGKLDVGVADAAAATTALTKTRKAEPTYLLLVTGRNNDRIWVYESSSLDFGDPGFTWTLRDSWSEAVDEGYMGNGHQWPSDVCTPPWASGGDWSACNHPHQMLNFVREASSTGDPGDLYLIGTQFKGGHSAHPLPDHRKNFIDLYKAEWCNVARDSCQTEFGPGHGEFTLRHVQREEVSTKPTNAADSDNNVVNFAASGGVYVSPTGELIIYGTEHANTGPEGTVKAGEWRHKHMVRDGSPTYRPTAAIAGPLVVPEGGETTLTGRADPAITKAWMELFRDGDFGGMSLVMDFDDRGKENFDDFTKLDFNNDGSSMRWFAPQNCSLRLNEKPVGHAEYPGRETRTLAGDGSVWQASNLHLMDNDDGDADINDQSSSMEFLPDCDQYYANQAFEMWWDPGGTGQYDVLGESVVISAANLDGPGVLTVGLEAVAAQDGTSGFASRELVVTNVPPAILWLDVRSVLGVAFHTDPPVTMVGAKALNLNAGFSDPEIENDLHSASIAWGDGSEEALAVDSKTVEGSHAFAAAGVHTIELTIIDDDGGKAAATTRIAAVDAMQVKALAKAELEALLPTGDSKDDKAIDKAIDEIERSLEADYWADGFYLTKHGKKVFDADEKAVKSLEKVGGAAASAAGALVDALVAADEALARSAIAAAFGGDQRKIDKAMEEMAKAAADIAAGKPDEAIDHYRKAWEHAGKAA